MASYYGFPQPGYQPINHPPHSIAGLNTIVGHTYSLDNYTHASSLGDMVEEAGLTEGTPVEVIWSDEYVGQFGFIVSCNKSSFYAVELESGDIVVLATHMVSARSALEALACAAD